MLAPSGFAFKQLFLAFFECAYARKAGSGGFPGQTQEGPEQIPSFWPGQYGCWASRQLFCSLRLKGEIITLFFYRFIEDAFRMMGQCCLPI